MHQHRFITHGKKLFGKIASHSQALSTGDNNHRLFHRQLSVLHTSLLPVRVLFLCRPTDQHGPANSITYPVPYRNDVSITYDMFTLHIPHHPDIVRSWGNRLRFRPFSSPSLPNTIGAAQMAAIRFTFCSKIKDQFAQSFMFIECSRSRHSSRQQQKFSIKKITIFEIDIAKNDTSCAPTDETSGVTDTICTFSPARLNVSIAVKLQFLQNHLQKKRIQFP